MERKLLSKDAASKLCGFDADQLEKAHVVHDGLVDLAELNDAILDKKIRYNFVKANNAENTPEFCSNRNISSNGLNVIDLFCGAGGSSSGFRLAGFNLVGAMDINEAAARTHALNFRNCKTIVGDITAITPEEFHKLIGSPRVDIVIGSPPCQTFSSLSQGKIKSLGKDIKLDIRNYFYKNYLDYVSYFKPKFFLMENVPGFKTKYDGAIFADYLSFLSHNLPEYTIKYDILDAQNYSVPQARKRLFVCGYKKQYSFDFPQESFSFCQSGADRVTVESAISDLPLINDNWRLDAGFYSKDYTHPYQSMMRYGSSDIVRNNICRISNPQAKEMFTYLSPGQRYIDLSEEQKKEISLFDSFDSSVIMGRCRRLPRNDISWTVIAHIGMDGYEYIHPTECRTLSVREAARLQSFTDDFIFTGNMREQYVQIGNAVPPLMSYAVASKIASAIKCKP